ncbi:hypothetical protein PS005_24675, partial [Shigella sonnei]|nr:hypothetical protein [Shigella sonnei]
RAVDELNLITQKNAELVEESAQVKNVTQLIAQISHSTLESPSACSSVTRAVDELNQLSIFLGDQVKLIHCTGQADGLSS